MIQSRLEPSRRADAADRRTMDLEREIARLELVNRVLADRVERTVDLQGRESAIFATAHALEQDVRARNAALSDAMERLQAANVELRAAKRAADAANRAKSAFLANMSHEIRTPMHGVLGLAELLLRAELPPRERETAHAIVRSAESLLTILDDILDFSKVEAGRLELESIPFDLADVLGTTVALHQTRAADRALTLTVERAPNLPRQVRGDPGRLRQVLTNLIGNAVKFTERGAVRVVCSTAPLDDGEVPRVAATFEVHDTGVGMDDTALRRIFDAFVQADSSTTRRFGGTGLGLAISRQLVRLMGGELDARSTLGRGSTFTFTIPLAVLDDRDTESLAIRGLPVVVVGADRARGDAIRHLLDGFGAATARVDDLAALTGQIGGATCREQCRRVLLIDGDAAGDRLRATAADLALAPGPCRPFLGVFGGAAEFAQLADHRLPAAPSASDLFDFLAAAVQHHRRVTIAEARGTDEEPLLGHVLVAEDNEVNRRVARGMLGRLGLAVTMCNDGAEALDLLAAQRFDAVLMDCHMPRLDGFDATRALRAREAEQGAPRTPVIALTASATPRDSQRCTDAGMDDFLSKPYRLAQLRAVLRRWLGFGDAASEPIDPQRVEPGRWLEVAPHARRPADGAVAAWQREIAAFLDGARDAAGTMRRQACQGEVQGLRAAAFEFAATARRTGCHDLAERAARLVDTARAEPASTRRLFEAATDLAHRVEELYRVGLAPPTPA